MAEENTAQAQPGPNDPQFQIHKIYIKDVSFQIPDGAQAFQLEWAPELNIEINTEAKPLTEANTHEVILTIKCTVNTKDKPAFVTEVQQAGIFEIANVSDEQLRQALGAYCPNVLYPYLREVISDVVTRGGFPQLSLAPINFDMLYEQQMQQQANGTES